MLPASLWAGTITERDGFVMSFGIGSRRGLAGAARSCLHGGAAEVSLLAEPRGARYLGTRLSTADFENAPTDVAVFAVDRASPCAPRLLLPTAET